MSEQGGKVETFDIVNFSLETGIFSPRFTKTASKTQIEETQP